MDWYYAETNQRKGPVDEVALAGLRGRGVVRGDTLVWHSGLDGWKPYAQVAPPPTPKEVSATAGPPAPETEEDPVLASILLTDKAAADESVTCIHSGQTAPKSQMVRHGNGWVLPEYMDKVAPGYGQAVAQLPDPPPAKEQILKNRKMDGPELIGFWSRVGSYILDSLILAVPAWLLWLPAKAGTEDSFTLDVETGTLIPQSAPIGSIALTLGGLLALTLFYFVFLVGKNGGTPGKRLLHYKIVEKRTGEPVSYARAAGRCLATTGFFLLGGLIYTLIIFVSESVVLAIILFLLPNITYLWVAWDEKKQGLHDHLAGTLVVRD